ncbi:MAG: non-canonical purine NTP pyrophosphatase [Acidobacteria bacterium]|nr:non-canonical purine NTP pyrophosphatase [Acidobacteriota bacterium]MBI3263585.1 non-canonical purine NTP pyrophosphatase [Acidobacteriota bacterium]
MKTLLVATTNPDKLREIRSILSGLDLDLRTLERLPSIPEAVEDGRTFAENARKKALHYAEASELPTVAEDSGLEIDALGGEPGVYSSRFGGASAPTYPDKFREIYRRLDARAALLQGPGTMTAAIASGRAGKARFVCALALADAGAILFETCGVIEGELAAEPRGIRGFGYDPILFYPPLGRTLGELSREEKAIVSHRGQAFRALREFLAHEVASGR